MSNIAYFTTSPAMLMRRWQASSATTTTTTCGLYTISIYAESNGDCPLFTSCAFGDCAEIPVLKLQYSTDAGSSWGDTGISLEGTSSSCDLMGTFDISTCETSLILRIYFEPCDGPVYFNYNYNSSSCPGPSNNKCDDCTELETSNVMPSGNVSIAFTICTYCDEGKGCCYPCCP